MSKPAAYFDPKAKSCQPQQPLGHLLAACSALKSQRGGGSSDFRGMWYSHLPTDQDFHANIDQRPMFHPLSAGAVASSRGLVPIGRYLGHRCG